MKKPKQETAVISFRVPTSVQKAIDRQAKREKKKRGAFVEAIFMNGFNARVTEVKA